MYRTVILLALIARIACTPSDLKVKIKSGQVIGHYVADGTSSVREFLGIPYGKPPIGPLRFAPPQAVAKWNKPFNASSFGPWCYIGLSTAIVGGAPLPPTPLPPLESEDCLSINVWAPTKRRFSKRKAAVLIWTYGGGYTSGSSSQPYYDGKNIVRDQENVVVVSFNYRANVFGFPNAPGQRNVGLLDIRLAIEWVRDNISAFGGDPKKITLFGESAGGSSTDAYLYFAKNDPIIAGAIIQSGTAETPINKMLGLPLDSWSRLSTLVGCPLSPPPENLECMRSIPATSLRAPIRADRTLVFIPSPDGATLWGLQDTIGRLSRGERARVPVLVGSTDQEIPNNQLQTEWAFTCPTVRVAHWHSRYQPTWQYRYFGSFPTEVASIPAGPWHGSEIPQIFGTFPLSSATPEQIASSKYIQGAWVAFAKDPDNGLSNYQGGWPKYDPNSPSLVRLAFNNVPGATFVSPGEYGSNCSLTEALPGPEEE